ncbi:MAG: hypothetical protein QOG55_2879 [Acidobacteriaceae bacterium]|jgi:hypothetical protein|nr:hypothetical protein [Acidobacteriaceae bacterium]
MGERLTVDMRHRRDWKPIGDNGGSILNAATTGNEVQGCRYAI